MALGACQYCGRQNDAGAQFCSDCGKPLTKAAAARAAVAAGGGGGGGGRCSSGTRGPPCPGPAPVDTSCPLWGAGGFSQGGGGGPDRRFNPEGRSDHSLVLVRG